MYVFDPDLAMRHILFYVSISHSVVFFSTLQFEHASHVVMSVIKLMNRIAQPTHLEEIESNDEAAAAKHDHTYGITSDPLTQFACAFSALIHDVGMFRF